jgi:hypothetical protein
MNFGVRHDEWSAKMRVYVFLALALLGNASLKAQMQDSRILQLDSHDVATAFPIGELVFVFRQSDIDDNAEPIVDLDKLQPAARAVSQGIPNVAIKKLIDQELKGRHDLRLTTASAVNMGDLGFVWKISWSLFPTIGGLGGQPYEYVAYVLPGGSATHPNLYLCNEFTFNPFDTDCSVFSSIPISKIKRQPKPAISETDAREIATAKLQKVIAEKNLPVTLTFHHVSRCTYPIEIHAKRIQDGESSGWAVNFVLEDNEILEQLKTLPLPNQDAARRQLPNFTVWVTFDGFSSQITTGTWNAEP